MKVLNYLLQKEFRQIFRNKSLLPIIFAMPIIQLLILPLAADYEIKNINVSIADHDHSSLSRQLISKITASGYFKLHDYNGSYVQALKQLETDQSDLILEIPSGFEKNLIRENKQDVLITINAINGVKANVGSTYLSGIIRAFNTEVLYRYIPRTNFSPVPQIEIVSSNRFNPNMNYKFLMVPGILVFLVTMIGVYLCSMNIVKEKEVGTIEQINVTPIRKHYFILGKLIPFWIIGMFVFSVGLFLVGRVIYDIVPAGNLFLLFGYLALYLVAVLGMGLLISTFCETQQQAMSVTFFFVMIFILMSGLFTSVDSMPNWAQVIAYLSPVTYFIEVIRMIILKGSGFNEIKIHLMATFVFALVFNSWAIINYKKNS